MEEHGSISWGHPQCRALTRWKEGTNVPIWSGHSGNWSVFTSVRWRVWLLTKNAWSARQRNPSLPDGAASGS